MGIIPTITPTLLPMFLKTFIKKYPKVNLIIEELTTDDIIKKLNGYINQLFRSLLKHLLKPRKR